MDIIHFVGYTIDIDVEVKNGTFEFVTKALDKTFVQSGKFSSFFKKKRMFKRKKTNNIIDFWLLLF